MYKIKCTRAIYLVQIKEEMMKYLVTGAEGFIDSAIVEQLIAKAIVS